MANNKGFTQIDNENEPTYQEDTYDSTSEYLEGQLLYYCGDDKPSVNTPIQVRLYEALPNIKYMIHSHCGINSEIICIFYGSSDLWANKESDVSLRDAAFFYKTK